MLPEPKVEVIGYRWVSSGGNKACDQCRSLHGKEFFIKPESGQESTSEMPEPPLHPNCRCTVQPITRATVTLPEGAQAQPDDSYIKGGKKVLGGYWLNNGRSIWDGPIWKKWCGENWGAGRDVRDPNAVGPADPSPDDDMDSACKDHDDCYDSGGAGNCDRKLVRALESLPDDPRDWEKQPSEHEIEDAKHYRKWAIIWFKYQMYRDEIRLEGYRESLPITP